MIVIKSPMMHEKIEALLTEYDESEIRFEFLRKDKLNLFFNSTAEDESKAAKVAKSLIKAQPWGTVLYFQVETEESH